MGTATITPHLDIHSPQLTRAAVAGAVAAAMAVVVMEVIVGESVPYESDPLRADGKVTQGIRMTLG